METNDRKSVNDKLSKYCPIASRDSFIEITEWTNGEGWDVTIDDRHFHLSYGELDAINYLTKHLEYGE